MRANALPLFMSNVTPAECLLDMLETVDTKRTWMTWVREFNEHAHILAARDRQNLAILATKRRTQLCREIA